MVGRKRTASGASKRVTRGAASRDSLVPEVVRDLLSEAKAESSSRRQDTSSEPPPKRRRRPGERPPKSPPKSPPKPVPKPTPKSVSKVVRKLAEDDDDGNIEFEDVPPPPIIQTITREDDEDDEDDVEFEDVEVNVAATASSSAVPASNNVKELNLNLTAQREAMGAGKRAVERRKAISREERERRADVHKVHLLCLLSHVERRNWWCNDAKVQAILKPLLNAKTVRQLNPRASLNQFGKTESLKAGITEASNIFRAKFKITERGMRRALWPEDDEQLKDFKLPDDAETTHDKDDFVQAAQTLEGSRDVGAQLFCTLLRSVGVQARLVCSLQPLPFAPGAPTRPDPNKTKNTPRKPSAMEIYAAAMAKYETPRPPPLAPGAIPSVRQRLGGASLMSYSATSTPTPPAPTPAPPTSRSIRDESSYPVYWVEVLNVAHQRWHPVDPLVTRTQWRPRALEPPASDHQNAMSYVMAFSPDLSARDVTRRYVKAYNAKTKRARIDGVSLPPSTRTLAAPADGAHPADTEGERWWRLALRRYRRRGPPADLDTIEMAELVAEEAKEPMPRGVADFKDHPVYALERHLRRHEVLVPGAEPSGTVAPGSKAPLERVFRRRDVRVARSRERWYRLGRVVRAGEEAVKILPKVKRKGGRLEEDEDEEEGEGGLFGNAEAMGTPIYTYEQTELYRPAPVVNGRVPRNRFGNLDVYVPSMVPEGGAYVEHERAAWAAWALGVDYAPALTGFEFKGRQGTAVIRGAVVPSECEEGVRAVIEGLADLEAEAEEEKRRRTALRAWSRFLKELRIRERVFAGVDEEAEERMEREKEMERQKEEEEEEGGRLLDEGSEDGGGGFFDDEEGGFVEEEEGQADHKGKGKAVAVDENEEDTAMDDAASVASEEYYIADDDEMDGGF